MDPDPEAGSILLQIIILLILTLINAFFAGAEMAVVSVNKNKIRMLADDGNKKAILLQSLFDDSTRFLSTIQVAITFAGFFSSASAATGISKQLGIWMQSKEIPFSETIAMVVVTILLSYFNLVFGELIPKRIALQKAERFSLMTVRPIYFMSKLLSPFIHLLSGSTKLFLKLVGMKSDNLEDEVSEEEIKAMLEEGSERGVFDESEMDMINSVFSFDDKRARDVMVPRRDVFTIDVDEDFDQYFDDILESRHSRIPVYSENVDNIIGVLHIKDFILKDKQCPDEKLDIRTLLQKPYFVPESKNAAKLFREMQQTRNRMAILIDEYGGFSGIVTIEDLVEEIMGDLNEENEEEDPEIVDLGAGSYLLEGGMPIDDLNDELELELEPLDNDTLSGYIIEKLGYIPKPDEEIEVCEGNLVFQVREVKENRITKLHLQIREIALQENQKTEI